MDYEVTKIPIIEITDTNGNIITIPSNSNDMNIVDSSLSLKKSIVDSELSFGNAISSEFSCQIFNITDDIKGNMIRLYLEDVNTHNRTTMFTGYIDKSTTDYVGDYRQIVAYDWLYYHRDDDVTDLWRSWTYDPDPNQYSHGKLLSILKNELEEFIDFQIDQSHGVNNNQMICFIYTHKEENVQSITLSQLLKMICEIQGTFPYIDETGTMIKFATLSNDAASIDLSDKYEKMSSTREEYLTKAVDGITVYSSSDTKLLSTLSTATNPYLISGNLLLNYTAKDLGKPTVRTYMRNVYNNTLNGYTQYLPFSLKMIMSDFSIFLGQRVYVSDTIYGYAMSIEYSGPCLIEQTISSIANSENLSKIPAKINDTLAQGSIIAENQESNEKAISDVNDNLSNNYYNKTQTENKFTDKADAIKSDKIRYLATSYDSVTTSDGVWGTWSDTPQKVTSTKKYLWTYHIYTMADGSTKQDANPTLTGVYGDTGPQGLPGSGGKVYSIKSEHQWIADGTKIDNKTVFKSDSNYHKGNGEARCLVEFSGYETFTIMCRSNGESNYDFLVVSTLNAPTVTKTTNVYKSFRGQASATNYTAVTYTGLDINADYFIRLAYIKDSSVDSGEDRAFFYIPEGVGLEEGIGIAESKPLYYVSNSSTYPAKPTSPVTTDTTNHNVWSTKMATVDNTYGYVFTCTQNKYTDSSYSWSDVVIDEASIYTFSEIQKLKDKIILKVDNNGHLVQVQLSADPSTGSQFNVKAETIDFSSEAFTISTNYLRITGSYFSLDATGKITCTGGTIGGWTIGTNALYNNTNSMSSTNQGTYIGIDGIRQFYSSSRYVDIQNGELTCVGGNISTSDNDYISTIANGRFIISTTNDLEVSHLYGTDLSNNRYGELLLREYNSSQVESYQCMLNPHGLWINKMNNGTPESVAFISGDNNRASFNCAMYVYSNITATGTIKGSNIGNYTIKDDSWPTTSIPTGTLTKLGYITLDKGVWVLSGKIQLSDNLPVNSVLQIGIGTNTTGLGVLSNSVVSTTNESGTVSYKNINASNILNITSNNTKVYLYARQNSGSNISINSGATWLRATQIA